MHKEVFYPCHCVDEHLLIQNNHNQIFFALKSAEDDAKPMNVTKVGSLSIPLTLTYGTNKSKLILMVHK